MHTMFVFNETTPIIELSPGISAAIAVPIVTVALICIVVCIRYCCKPQCCETKTTGATASTTLIPDKNPRTPGRVDEPRPAVVIVDETPPRVDRKREVRRVERAPPDRSSERRAELDRLPAFHKIDDNSDYCPQDICKQYSISLGMSRAYYNVRYNKCYCIECYSKKEPDYFTVAGSIYTVPRGWTRFGLEIDQAFANAKQIFKRWHTTFHGTSKDKLELILRERFVPFPGDSLLSGDKFSTHLPDKNHIYTSPSIYYASLQHMCPTHTAKIKSQWYDVQIVLECKQNPEGITKKQGYKQNVCRIIPDDEIEWKTKLRSSVVPYGLLIRAKKHQCTDKCAAKHSS